MSVGLAVVVASSALLLLAVAMIVLPADEATASPIESARVMRRSTGLALAAGVAAAAAVLVVSGWILPALLVGAVVGLWIGRRESSDRTASSDVDRVEALASWIENLRDVLVAGDQPIGAITATVPTCPLPIRAPVRRLSTALGHQEPTVAFRRFADDLDDPLGDLVAVGLLVAVERGARTVGVLSALAEQARTQADRRRILEAERAPVRREVTLLTLIMAGLLGGVLLLGRADYLSAYDTTAGQIFLSVIIGCYALLLLRVQRLARFPRPGRFLSSTTSTAPTITSATITSAAASTAPTSIGSRP